MKASTGICRWQLAIAAGLACVLLSGGARLAQNVYTIHIESQPLDTALQEFARQTGLQILFFSELTEGHRSAAVTGRYTVDSAMTALLSGSNLTYRPINARTIEIVPARRVPSEP